MIEINREFNKEIFIYLQLTNFLKQLEKSAPPNKCYKIISSGFLHEDDVFTVKFLACADLPTDQIHNYLMSLYKIMIEPKKKRGFKMYYEN